MGRLVNKADVMARTALASVEDVRNRKTGVVCSRASPSEARPVWMLRLWFITERGRLAAPGFFEAEQTAPAHIAPGPCFIPLFHAAACRSWLRHRRRHLPALPAVLFSVRLAMFIIYAPAPCRDVKEGSENGSLGAAAPQRLAFSA